MANTTIDFTGKTGSIAFTGGNSYFLNSGDSKLILTGIAPDDVVLTINNRIIPVDSGALSFSGKTPMRGTGLQLIGELVFPSVEDAFTRITDVGSIAFASVEPQVFTTGPTDTKVVPLKGSLALTGYESPIHTTVSIATDSLTITGSKPQPEAAGPSADNPRYPFFAIMTMTGYAPSITVTTTVDIGTPITNQWATTNVPVNYQIDDRTGFKIKVKNPMVEEYTGHMVRPESLDKRSEQEFLKSKKETRKGATRPDDTGTETYVEDLYPNGVSTDDL